MRPLIMLQLAAVTLAGEHRRQGSHPRRSGRHRLGKSLGKDLKPPKAAEDERQLAELRCAKAKVLAVFMSKQVA